MIAKVTIKFFLQVKVTLQSLVLNRFTKFIRCYFFPRNSFNSHADSTRSGVNFSLR